MVMRCSGTCYTIARFDGSLCPGLCGRQAPRVAPRVAGLHPSRFCRGRAPVMGDGKSEAGWALSRSHLPGGSDDLSATSSRQTELQPTTEALREGWCQTGTLSDALLPPLPPGTCPLNGGQGVRTGPDGQTHPKEADSGLPCVHHWGHVMTST